MKKIVILFLVLCACQSNKQEQTTSIDFETVFEKSNGTETTTYDETIAYYQNLANVFPEITIKAVGQTDSGKPLHVVTLNPEGTGDDFNSLRTNNRILLINNGIHPGESDGIDATMMLFRDIAQGKIKAPEHVILAAIPIYNIGGSLNRNSSSRTNQNGPKEYGFRGNARNYDLNRDFIKSDTKNAKAFAEIFHLVKPDVFIDNHVSNGADYQYILTHLFTQHNKLGNDLGNYIHTTMMPKLEEKLASKDWDITPYVNVFNRTPEQGFTQFMDSPRYSTGYTTLFNTLGMMVETHMLKPYKQRVEGTYQLMSSMIQLIEEDYTVIKDLRNSALQNIKPGNLYPIDWKIDTTKSSTLQFKGYEGEMITSEITGSKRLKYDRSKPFTKEITYQNYFKPKKQVVIPNTYIIPQGWHNITELLTLNNVEMLPLEKDTTITVEAYTITDYQTRQRAYEGHYPHYNTKVQTEQKTITFRKGDYLVPLDQNAVRYLVETLEPSAPDSFFNWNFFDTILQQKEGFSPYVWEDKALEILESNNDLKIEFETKKQNDDAFANNWYAQLDWLHKQSDHYEKAHLQYPIYRMY